MSKLIDYTVVFILWAFLFSIMAFSAWVINRTHAHANQPELTNVVCRGEFGKRRDCPNAAQEKP